MTKTNNIQRWAENCPKEVLVNAVVKLFRGYKQDFNFIAECVIEFNEKYPEVKQ